MRPFARWLFPILALAACEPLAIVPKDGGAEGGAGGAGASGGGGAGGARIECLLPIDCAGQDTECRKRSCVGFVCGFEDVPAGAESARQMAGDCTRRVCDGAGHVTVIAEPLDVLDDHNPCTTDVCSGLSPRNEPWGAGACGLDGEGVCDGHGSCAGCVVSSQCHDGALCVNNQCVPPSCVDGARGELETDVDCGGPSCGPCAKGEACLRDRDCESAVCDPASRRCLAASCTDGKKNGAEPDVDCGGTCTKKCAPGAGCKVDADCLGGLCSGAICLPSCFDGELNGAETGTDCGGHACAPCAMGAGCVGGEDCASGVCQASRCVPPSCVDGVAGEGESDVDCGGSCAPCAPGRACATGADCESAVCAGTLCASPSCVDHARNAAETGTDCGGPTCAACANGEGCKAAADCASGVCSAGVCAAPSCTDGVKDLLETDVDCGGPECSPCGAGLACAADGDCTSAKCAMGKCTAPKCDDGLANGDESDLDCGGSCAPCLLAASCFVHEDCVTVACAGGTCVPPSCFDHVRNADETGTDCGGPLCDTCPGGQGCESGADCASGACTGKVCESSCTDLVHDGDETGVDCGGSCPPCATGGACDIDEDCESLVCDGGTCLAPTCTDGVRNADEIDVDCGPSCGPCKAGQSCTVNSDCLTLACPFGVCEEQLLFSEVRSQGPHDGTPADDQFADEIVELYNPGNAPIVMDSTWQVWHRSAQGACQGKFLRYTGVGLTIPPKHHLLLVGLAYAGPPYDAVMMSDPGNSIADSASLWILHGTKITDAMCYAGEQQGLDRLLGLEAGCAPYICRGTPANNLPHNGTKGPASSVDVSLERKPGGALGNGQDTGDTANDFRTIAPSTPQSLASPPTP